MGFHICITNEKVFSLSVEHGVYGNVGKSGESRSVVWGKIRDLYAVKPGDLVLLYVKSPISQLYGVYEVTSIPYVCNDDLFQDETEGYPFRFNFRVKHFFPIPIPDYEFYSLVDSGAIDSLSGLQRDVNSTYRGIRQLFESEFQAILHLFLKYNPKTNHIVNEQIVQQDFMVNQIEATDFVAEQIENYITPTQLLFNRVPSVRGVAILEDVLSTYIIYNVLHNTRGVRETLGLVNLNELIIEAPIFKSMQYRSDILATFKYEDKVYYYSFFEIKKDERIGIRGISQLMSYLKSFASRKSLEVNSYEGVYIAKDFSDDLIDYLTKRKTVERENIISLFAYNIDNQGVVTLTRRI